MSQLSQYFAVVENTQALFDTVLNTLQNKLALLTAEDPDLLDDNYSDAIFQIQSAVNQLSILDNVYKFERITKQQMQYLFGSYDAGENSQKINVDVPHIVTQYDTPRTIERKYNMPWAIIQQYNNILPSQLTPLMTINIPLQIPLSQISQQDIPTFGDQQGNNILGMDIENGLEAGSDGDLKVLTPIDSFAQSIQNNLSMLPGTLPYYEDIGFDPKIEDNYNAEEKNSILQLRIMNTLLNDNRIKQVDISGGTKEGTLLNFDLTITSISGNKTVVPI
jgi:hypothetical protein